MGRRTDLVSNRKAATRTVKRLVPLFVLVVVLLTACGSSVDPLSKPPAVSVPPTTTTLADFSNVSLQHVPGTTTTLGPSPIRGGNASISGRVLLNGVPAGGATIQVERYDADSRAGSLEIKSNGDGTYKVDQLVGGRYRVRAFRSPDAAMREAQLFFLGANENKLTDLAMSSFGGGTTINAWVTPDPPILGSTATLTVSIANRGVDGGGVARSFGQAGVPVQVTTAGGRVIVSANPATTGSNGRVSFTFQCASLDRQGLNVSIPGGASTPVSVANCALPPTTTTTSFDDEEGEQAGVFTPSSPLIESSR